VTSDIDSYQFSNRGKIITLVDTPGFDDSNISDSEILMKLLGWLKETQEDEQKLSGILYLHRIDAPRMQGSAL
jgi:predicted GTPase